VSEPRPVWSTLGTGEEVAGCYAVETSGYRRFGRDELLPHSYRGTDVAWHSLYESFAAAGARPSKIGFVVIGNWVMGMDMRSVLGVWGREKLASACGAV
jgi:hypothetical protein